MELTYPAEGSPADGAPKVARRRRSSHSRRSNRLVALMVVASAVGGGFAGCHPTGVAAVDVIYGAAAAGLIALAASRATRSTLLVMTAVGFGFSRSWLFIPAAVALVLAFTSVFQRRAYRRLNALVGALGAQVLLRWTHVGFHGLTAIVGTLIALVVLVDGWRHCASRTRRIAVWSAVGVVGLGVVFTVPVVLGALVARHPVERGISLARSSLSAVENGEAPTATTQLRQAASSLDSAHSDVASWWDLGGYLVPGVAQQERALDRGTSAGAHLTSTAAAQAGGLNFSSLRYTGGRVNLDAVKAFQGPAETLDAAVVSAQNQLQHISSPWLIAPISDRLAKLGTVLDKARSTSDLAVLGLKDAPALLGGDGVRHYFVAFMSPAETRGLGGFIGAYGELTVDNGKISLTRAGRATQLADNVDANLKLNGPATYVSRYGVYNPQDYFEDLTYSPDLPTVENVIAQLYPQVGGDQLDGVLVLDPYSLAALLHFTGPITVDGFDQPLTPANAADVLLRQQYLLPDVTTTLRHDLLQEALAAGFTRLTNGSLPSPKTLASVLGPMVHQGRLLFFSSHPTDQVLLNRIGLTGTFPDAQGGDLLATTLANAANSKIDAYVHQKTVDNVTFDPASGHVTSHVTITLQNTAPSSGMPKYVIGSYKGSGLAPGGSSMWLSLYTPLKVTGASLDGNSFSFTPPTGEAGVLAYSGYVTIPSMSTVQLSVTLDGYVRPGPDYSMTLRLQPLANPQSVQVTATPVTGWSANNANTWTSTADQVERHSWIYRYR